MSERSNIVSTILRRNPLLWTAIALIGGILVGYHTSVAMSWCVVLSIGGLIGMALCVRRNIFPLFVAIFFFFVGMMLCRNQLNEISPVQSTQNGVFQVVLTDYPIQKTNSIKAECEVYDSLETRRCMLYIHTDSLSQQLTMGDILLVGGSLSMPKQLNPENFDYAAYLLKQGFAGTLYAREWQLAGKRDDKTLISWGKKRQKQIVDYYAHQGLEKKELGIISALTVGDKDLLDQDVRTTFSAAGAAHILAVSGLHVGIIYLILIEIITCFGKLKPLRKQTKLRLMQSFVIIACLWLYSILTGLSASVMRAALMFSLGEIGRCINRFGFSINIVGAAAVIILLINPLAVYSVSFQLSFAAVLAILTLGQKFDLYCSHLIVFTKTDRPWQRYGKKILRYAIGLLAISTAAQIGTLPFTLYYFNQFSTYFWLTNLIMLPYVQFIAIPSLLLLPFLPAVPQTLFAFLYSVLSWIEQLPFATVSVWINSFQALLLAGIIICIYKKQWHIFGTAAVLVLIAYSFYLQQENSNRQELIVYSSRQADVIQIIEGNQSLVITNDTASAIRLSKGINKKYGVKSVLYANERALIWNNEHIVIVSDSILQDHALPHPCKCELLLLGDVGHVGAERLISSFEPKKILLLGTMKSWKKRQCIEYCEKYSIAFHDLMCDGAYEIKIDD
ncbi:MAG: ComEC/Rec2 family competence protein [Paludibacteraceae bacterium]|nr:ComEC/Rec2 family competence protein [Paludibacteraceae bacterium]